MSGGRIRGVRGSGSWARIGIGSDQVRERLPNEIDRRRCPAERNVMDYRDARRRGVVVLPTPTLHRVSSSIRLSPSFLSSRRGRLRGLSRASPSRRRRRGVPLAFSRAPWSYPPWRTRRDLPLVLRLRLGQRRDELLSAPSSAAPRSTPPWRPRARRRTRKPPRRARGWDSRGLGGSRLPRPWRFASASPLASPPPPPWPPLRPPTFGNFVPTGTMRGGAGRGEEQRGDAACPRSPGLRPRVARAHLDAMAPASSRLALLMTLLASFPSARAGSTSRLGQREVLLDDATPDAPS